MVNQDKVAQRMNSPIRTAKDCGDPGHWGCGWTQEPVAMLESIEVIEPIADVRDQSS
ncbi:hypothetical protein M5C99_04960 [Acidovorax sp. NCPPB 2350]|nr:hypothetical protein M5C99_04960 [Acidovorax sp. NCPPB 2350]